MKKRLPALGLILALSLSLCACATEENGFLKGKKNAYSQTVSYAKGAWNSVDHVEAQGNHTLTNRTARLDLGNGTEGLTALTSLQTGEALLQNTVTTRLTATDGTVGQVFGGTQTVHQGNYGVSYSLTDSAARFPASADKAIVLKDFDLTDAENQNAFSALDHQVSSEKGETGWKITSQGKNRSQFGARYLNIDLGTADRYYLSVTLKATDLSAIKCYFSTQDVPLTEDTLLGTLELPKESQSDFITVTAPVEHRFWQGTLQTLLFRLPEGEMGSLEISRIAIFTENDPIKEKVANTLWTVYSDRIYFSQWLNSEDSSAVSTTFSVNAAKCIDVVEEEHFIGLKMIDGSLLGFVRPSGGTLRVERNEGELQLILDWSPSQTPAVSLRIYLNYTDDLSDLRQLAQEERTPLTEENFTVEGAKFVGYDPKGGMYRLKKTGEQVTLSVKKTSRILYFYLEPDQGTAWSLRDKQGNRLPIDAGTTFPLCPKKSTLTVQLIPETASEKIPEPDFLSQMGWIRQGDAETVLSGLCSRNTVRYDAPDASCSATLTTTRLNNGKATLYDVEYSFRSPVEFSDLRTTFPLFSFGLEYGFDRYFYLDGENQSVSVEAGEEEFSYLASMPYVGLSSEGESAGWLITKGEISQRGMPETAHLCLRYKEVDENTPNELYLSLDQKDATFGKGDTVKVQIIQWHDEPSEESLNQLRTKGNFRLIQTEHKDAKTVVAMGMEDTVLLKIEGFESYKFPKLSVNGEPFAPNYHVYVDENGYYGFAFAVAVGTEIEIKN